MSAEIEKQVFDLVKKRLKADDVSRDATWEQLGADSLDAAEFFMDLEDQLGVQVPDNKATEMKKIGDIIDYVVQAKKQGGKQ
jgi:acyl carrier protein